MGLTLILLSKPHFYESLIKILVVNTPQFPLEWMGSLSCSKAFDLHSVIVSRLWICVLKEKSRGSQTLVHQNNHGNPAWAQTHGTRTRGQGIFTRRKLLRSFWCTPKSGNKRASPAQRPGLPIACFSKCFIERATPITFVLSMAAFTL